MNKNETKYFYTASLMDEALLELLKKKDFDFITVKEICQKAGVNRTTFYLHYESTNDLLVETIEMISKKFSESFIDVDKTNLTKESLTKEKYIIPYLNFIKENKTIYKVVHERNDLFKTDKTFKYMYENIFDKALTNFGVKEKDKKYVFQFYTKGALAIIEEWINGDCVDDINYIASLISKYTHSDDK